MRRVFICFLEEIEDSKKAFRDYLTSNSYSETQYVCNNIDRTYGIVSERIHPSFALGEIHSRLACGHSSIHGLRTHEG